MGQQLRLFMLVAASLWLECAADSMSASYDAAYGVFLGPLSSLLDGDVEGKAYIVNDTTLQLVNFTFNGKASDVYFWLDKGETPTKDGFKVSTYEFGITPLGQYDHVPRVVLNLPSQQKVSAFRSLSLYDPIKDKNYGGVAIPETALVPKSQFLGKELFGSRYSVGSGPILIVDRRTIKVFGFTFEADKAPDGYFFVGRGPNVAHDEGVKVPIRGRDTPDLITPMSERYRGGQDIIIDLPEGYDIDHIDWLSIYCYKFRVDFGHVRITNVSQFIPPYVPPQRRFDDVSEAQQGAWQMNALLGTPKRQNFTFQLGPPGGKRGYLANARLRPSSNVCIEGGDNRSSTDFYNPLYVSDDPFGGYAKLTPDEQQKVRLFAPSDPSSAVGRLCIWRSTSTPEEADRFESFVDFKHTLRLECDEAGKPHVFTFTPDKGTPDTLFYQSYGNFNMGQRIYVVDEIPENLEDFSEEPYQYNAWSKLNNLQLEKQSSAGVALTLSAVMLPLVLLAILIR
ncbi:DOMON domain-containing protein [Aphelenchoides avenae]|nr:DOMON domain-containing protein [Aphelenchus avenae]